MKIFIAISWILLLTGSVQEKPRVLIIGDSISIGYTPFVKESLDSVADVFHNPGNAQHAGTGLDKIEDWIVGEEYNIIQFNWGLWDLCYRHTDSKTQGNRDKINGEITHTVEEYTAKLDSIVSILKKTTEAKLLFLTTTYVPENEAGRFKRDAIRYNEAAKAVMEKHSVAVNDIYEQSLEIHKMHGKGLDDVHYSTQGYKRLGELVAKFLKKEVEAVRE